MCSSHDMICRAPFTAPHLAAATSRGVPLYQCVDDQLNLIATFDQQEISLSLDWTLDKYVASITVLS